MKKFFLLWLTAILVSLSAFANGGKLKAGPVWDMHYSGKSGAGYHAKDKLYYKQLFKVLKFVQRVKDKWYGTDTEVSFSDLMGNGPAERVDSIKTLIQQAGDRDLKMWGKTETVAYQAERAIAKYNNNIHWINFCIKDLPYVTGVDDPTGIAVEGRKTKDERRRTKDEGRRIR